MTDFSAYLSVYGLRETFKEAPSAEDWYELQQNLGFVFPEDFRTFYEQARYYYFEGELPSISGKGTDGVDWLDLVARERHSAEVQMPEHLIPFCSVGNGDFHCFRKLDPNGTAYDVIYWYGDQGADQMLTPAVLALDFRAWLEGYAEDRF